MSEKPSLKWNFVFKLFYEILAMITPLITAPYVSRVLGADGIGIYSYTQSCVSYLVMFAILGTNVYGTREIARYRDDKYEYSKAFWEIELITVFTSGICLVIWALVILFSSAYRIYFIALTPCILSQTFDITWFYTGHERVSYTVFFNALCKIAGVIFIFACIRDKSDLMLYIFMNSFILMLGNLSMWVFLPKMLVKVKISAKSMWKHFKETVVYFIPTIATSIYTVLDKTLIGVITADSYENGFYEQATKITNIAKSVSFAALNSIMSARMSYLYYENKFDEAKRRLKQSMDVILFMSIGSMFGIIAISENFVPLFFGPGYEPVVDLLRVMSVLVVIIGISNCIANHYHTPVGKIKLSTKFLIAGSVINLILNLLLIPFIGSMGAVFGSIGAELVITLLYVHFNDGYLNWKDILVLSYKKILAGLIMLVAVNYICDTSVLNGIVTLVMQVVSGIIVYFISLVILKDSSAKYILTIVFNRMRLSK